MDHEQLIGLGCDYITGTTPEDSLINGLQTLGLDLMHSEACNGNQARPWGQSGFTGYSCGLVQLGMRENEVMLRLSGNAAAQSWKRVVQLSQNISRMDLQATIRVPSGPTRKIERHHREALSDAKAKKDIPIVRWIRENRGGYTLYLGSRESLVFGRLYDKWQRDKLDHYKEAVRFEVQFQKGLAGRVSRTLESLDSPLPRVASYVQSFFVGRGVRLTLADADGLTFCSPRSRSDDERRLMWLSRAVRPSLLSLADRGKLSEVLEALGIAEFVEIKL